MLPRDHEPDVVLSWPAACIADYIAGLQASLGAMRPIVHAAQEWAASPQDDDLEMRLFLAVANYRLPVDRLPVPEDSHKTPAHRAKLRAAWARRRERQIEDKPS